MQRVDGLAITYRASGTIAPYRIVKHGGADQYAAIAVDGAASLLGVSDQLGADAAEDEVDVNRSGIAEVEYGGNVTRGDPLTADAQGRAITASPGAGANAYIVGFAEKNGVSGDVGAAFVCPQRIQG